MSTHPETPREKRYRKCLEVVCDMLDARICELVDMGCEDAAEMDVLKRVQRSVNATLKPRKLTKLQIANKLRDYEPGN